MCSSNFLMAGMEPLPKIDREACAEEEEASLKEKEGTLAGYFLIEKL